MGETTTELFHHILPDIYPDLDTLIVTGNNFSILPNENIFGENNRHKKLSFVNISNNGIQSFGAQTFIGMPRVEYLHLDGNTLNEVNLFYLYNVVNFFYFIVWLNQNLLNFDKIIIKLITLD